MNTFNNNTNGLQVLQLLDLICETSARLDIHNDRGYVLRRINAVSAERPYFVEAALESYVWCADNPYPWLSDVAINLG